MRMGATRFEVDREGRKLLGVCAGLSRTTGLDATIIRVAVVLAALFVSFTWTAIFYFAAAFAGGLVRRDRASHRHAQRDEISDRIRSHDLRMQAVETYVAGPDSRLAREIEELRQR